MAALTDGTFPVGEKLVSELELAQMYGISRPTLREILSGLERDGLVRRVRGVGTFASKPGRQVNSALNVDVGVTEALSGSGVPSEVRLVGQLVAPMPKWMADKLTLPEESLGLRLERVIDVDGAPAAHVVDVIPVGVLDEAANPAYTGGSVYAFLESSCRLELHGGLADIVPVLPTPTIARHLMCGRGVPLLRMEQIEYEKSGRAVLFSQEHYLAGVITLSVRRERMHALDRMPAYR